MRKNPSISLNEHHQGLIARLVETGRYQGASDVVRAALRLLEHHEALREAELRSALQAGLDDIEAGRVTVIGDPDAAAGALIERGEKRTNRKRS